MALSLAVLFALGAQVAPPYQPLALRPPCASPSSSNGLAYTLSAVHRALNTPRSSCEKPAATSLSRAGFYTWDREPS